MDQARVLVVENEALMRELLVEMFVEAGFSCDEASDGDAAAKLIHEYGYSLIVTDIGVPGTVSGAEVARLAREQNPGIRIVIVADSLDAAIRLKLSHYRCAVLAKPYSPHGLIKTAREMLIAG